MILADNRVLNVHTINTLKGAPGSAALRHMCAPLTVVDVGCTFKDSMVILCPYALPL